MMTAVKAFKMQNVGPPNRDLLSRNNSRSALTQPINICQSFLACAKLAVLPLQNRRNGLPPLRRIIDFLDFVGPPILAQGRAGVKPLYVVKVMEIVVKQPTGVGNT